MPTVHGAPTGTEIFCEYLPPTGSFGSRTNSARLVAPAGYHGFSRKSVSLRYAILYGLSPSKLPSYSFSAHMLGMRSQRYSTNWPYWNGLISPANNGSRGTFNGV